MYRYNVSIIDKIISALGYLTFGWAGIIWMIILYLQKKSASSFLRFNTMQAVFLAIIFYIFNFTLSLVMGILTKIPIIQIIVSSIQLFFLRPILFNYSLLQIIIDLFILYLVLWSLNGKIPVVYKISDFLKNK